MQNAKFRNKKVIFIFGPPGCGKGTQGMLLSSKFDLYYFETSKLIENKVLNAKKGEFVISNGEKYYLDKEKELWLTGKLNSPPFVVWLVKEKIEKLAASSEGIVFSGSPRTIFEAKKIVPIIKKLYGSKNIKAFLLEINPNQTVWRNTHRRICELMRHPILHTIETAELKKCPLDGSDLVKRKGLDDPEIIKVRLKEYKERTFPIIDYLKGEGIRMGKINGEQSVTDVFFDILAKIKN